MSDDCDCDLDWWKKARDASLERRQEEAAAASGVQIGDTFLIVTEGEVTEPIYFELFLRTLELSRVTVVVIPGWASDPRHVVHSGFKLAEKQIQGAEKDQLAAGEPARFDHVWAVIDTDVAVRQGFWPEVLDLANDHGVRLAQSTPCFEYWLLLHLVDHPTTRADLHNGDAAKSAVKKALGHDYSTNQETATPAIASFIDQWPKAVGFAEYARKHHIDGATPPPGNPSTDVDLLVRALNDSVRAEIRKLKS